MHESGEEFHIILTDYDCPHKVGGRCWHPLNINKKTQQPKYWCGVEVCPITSQLDNTSFLDEPKVGDEVTIPRGAFLSGIFGKAKVVSIDGSDVVVEFENGKQGVCQVYQIPEYYIWCGVVLGHHLNGLQSDTDSDIIKSQTEVTQSLSSWSEIQQIQPSTEFPLSTIIEILQKIGYLNKNIHKQAPEDIVLSIKEDLYMALCAEEEEGHK